MTQPVHQAKQHQPNYHIVSTTLIGVVCLASLLAAGFGLYNSRSAKADLCGLVAQQAWGIQTTVQNDQHLIPKGVKKITLSTLDAGHAFMAKHCPPESLTPPEAEKAVTGNPADMLKQLMGSMIE